MPALPLLLVFFLMLWPVGGGAQESDLLSCTDGTDNDGDGLIDCDDPGCARLLEGCQICGETSSFVDTILAFAEGCGRRTINPRSTLGVADFVASPTNNSRYMITGEGGWIRWGFTDNILTNSGDGDPDLHVFEVEEVIQESLVFLRPRDEATRDLLVSRGIPEDAAAPGFFAVGQIDMDVRSLDIDALLPGLPRGRLHFDAIEVRDIDEGRCRSEETPGADIDAVCALSSLPLVDCAGAPLGASVVDDCGVCLPPNDPTFNRSCLDCAGEPNGPALVDSCGFCLPPDDPAFGQSCRDCLGVINGTAAPDRCGTCRAAGDPRFNSECLDCAGTVLGPARVDDCGNCLDTLSNLFNRGCGPARRLYVPNAFSPNADGVNDRHRATADRELVVDLLSYRVFDRWGALVFENSTTDFRAAGNWWDGTVGGRAAAAGTYLYVLVVRFADGEERVLRGGVAVVR